MLSISDVNRYALAAPSCRSARDVRRAAAPMVAKREMLSALLSVGTALFAWDAHAAVGFKKELKKRKIPLEDYSVSDLNGLKFYDLEEGRGLAVKPGDVVEVHFDCMYKGLDVESTRYARLLGGNRTIAEPFEFVAGQPVTGVPAARVGDSANALFSGAGGPKPPPALSLAVIGMKAGGKRSIIVDEPTLGYPKGIKELPPSEPFELKVEILSLRGSGRKG